MKFLNSRVGLKRILSSLYIFNKCLQGCKESKNIGFYFVYQTGIAACQIARAYGLKVLGTAGTEEGRNIVLRNGAHEVFNHREVNYIDKIKVKLFYSFMKAKFCFLDLCVFFSSFYQPLLSVCCFFLMHIYFMPMCVLNF